MNRKRGEGENRTRGTEREKTGETKTVRRVGQPTQERQPRLQLRHPLPPPNRHNTEMRREPRADFRFSVSLLCFFSKKQRRLKKKSYETGRKKGHERQGTRNTETKKQWRGRRKQREN
jgi:hypothetical protein